jgi:arylsulfatase
MVWLNEELHAVKWKDFKINFKRQQHFHDPELPLGFARITHLMEDPKEREAVNQRYVRWWVMQHAHRVVREFEESKKKEELIPTGSPLDFVPRPYERTSARSADKMRAETWNSGKEPWKVDGPAGGRDEDEHRVI